jgi:hypothetical protein
MRIRSDRTARTNLIVCPKIIKTTKKQYHAALLLLRCKQMVNKLIGFSIRVSALISLTF